MIGTGQRSTATSSVVPGLRSQAVFLVLSNLASSGRTGMGPTCSTTTETLRIVLLDVFSTSTRYSQMTPGCALPCSSLGDSIDQKRFEGFAASKLIFNDEV